MNAPKETIGVKIPADWKQQIKAIAADAGITPSEWLYGVIGEALGKTDVNAVNSLDERVSALEKKAESFNQLEEWLTRLTQDIERSRALKNTSFVNTPLTPVNDVPEHGSSAQALPHGDAPAPHPKTGEVCPNCQSPSFKIEGYVPNKANATAQKRRCKNCDRVYRVPIVQPAIAETLVDEGNVP